MDRHPQRPAARATCALALALALVPAPAAAAPFLAYPRPAAAQSVGVEVLQASPSVAPNGVLRANVAVTLAAPAEYVEVRLRLRGPSGALLYQKTEVRANLPAGAHVVSYEYDLGKLALKQARYPIEIRVLATGALPTNVSSRLLVVEPTTKPVPVAIVVTLSDVPSVGIDGRFTRDPAAPGLR